MTTRAQGVRWRRCLSCTSATSARSSTARRVALQERAARRACRPASSPDVLLLLEHPPVYTRGPPLGRRASCRWARPGTARRASTSSQTDRGGKLTYHGPGQLVGYPIMRDRRRRRLPAHDGARDRRRARRGGHRGARRARRGPDYTGVWVEDRKIASIGVHVSRGVTTHGFAVNVDNDLQPFEWVVPCGLRRRADDLDRRRRPAQRRRPRLLPPPDGATRSRTAFGRRQRLVTPASGWKPRAVPSMA